MKEKKTDMKDWLNTGEKNALFVKKMFTVVITIYIIYQLGYGIGTFLAHMGF